jgi:hypothetical protein
MLQRTLQNQSRKRERLFGWTLRLLYWGEEFPSWNPHSRVACPRLRVSPGVNFVRPEHASCGAYDKYLLLLRRTPPSPNASEPIASERSSCKFGALANMSSACGAVPCNGWEYSSTGMVELLAHMNWR